MELLVFGRDEDVADLALAFDFFCFESGVRSTIRDIPVGWLLTVSWVKGSESSSQFIGIWRGGRRLEKGVEEAGSMRVQFSRIEEGFEMSIVGAGIFSRISSIMSRQIYSAGVKVDVLVRKGDGDREILLG